MHDARSIDGFPILVYRWIGRKSKTGERGHNDVIWQSVLRILSAQQVHHWYKLEERTGPPVKEGNGNSIRLGGEESDKVNVVLVAIIIVDGGFEVRERIDNVFLFAPGKVKL